MNRCKPHTWAPHSDGVQCVKCLRTLTAEDDAVKRASVLTRLAAEWHRDLLSVATVRLFPPTPEAT